MLSIQNLEMVRGTKVLLEDINFAVFVGQVVGIVGSNGCGKSSLFAAILGEIEPQRGEVNFDRGLKIASLAQEVAASDITAVDFVISGDADLYQVLQKLKIAEANEDYETVLHCHTQLHEMNGYSAEGKAAKILNGLGFSSAEIYQSIGSFSGGWRMRLNLAKCLFAPSNLLLLDEPTNHLDMETIIWLEGFLKNYSGAILMVSHDQDFLDNTVTHIAHIENKRLKMYTGNYSSFVTQRAEQNALQNALYTKQQTQIDHMKKFVERFKAKASKAKQAQSRLKAIERMELIKPAMEKSQFHFKFLAPKQNPNYLLNIKKVDLGYDTKTVIQRADFSVRAGERIGLLGINGAGKSTFIKGMCGELEPMRGLIDRAPSLVIGYFAQHQVDHLPMDKNALTLLAELNETKTEKELISYLASFGFTRDESLAPLARFSGGEKSRVALAMIIFQRPNLLMLDEPTNHLDLEMRQALTYALQEFVGAMILVSHDRHLMRTLVDELYTIDGGKVARFDGTVEDYQALYA